MVRVQWQLGSHGDGDLSHGDLGLELVLSGRGLHLHLWAVSCWSAGSRYPHLCPISDSARTPHFSLLVLLSGLEPVVPL